MSARRQEEVEGPEGVRSPFGAARPADARATTTMTDAVRRCRWIAVDLNADAFALFFTGPATGRTVPLACFDSHYPDISAETRRLSGSAGSPLARHARNSSAPCWWRHDAAAAAPPFTAYGWCVEVPAPLGGTTGIAFPVHAGSGPGGIVLFLGSAMTGDEAQLFELHGRCFTLFEAVVRIRPAGGSRFPTLSPREIECLRLTAEGRTSSEIAKALSLSPNTADQYIANTVQKLDAVSRTHAVAKALRLGLID